MNTAFINCLDDYIAEHHYRLVNSVLVYKNKKLVLERYYNKFTTESRNNLKSVWKSILSLTLGICLDEGIIKSLDDSICRYLHIFNEGIHPYHKLITIRHLLTMSSGIYWNSGVHYHCPMFEQLYRSGDWVAHIADVQMKVLPGSVFQYKEWDVILLSAVISKALCGTEYGKTSWDICNEYLYKPLDIKSEEWPITKCCLNYNVMKGEEQSNLSARDMAKIGQLMLNNGKWNGKQIVSESYIKKALMPSDVNSGYGYLWWLFGDYYGCRGFGGQEINIYPKDQIVTVVQATPIPSSKSYGDISMNIMDNATLHE